MTDATKALVYVVDGITVPVTDSRKVAEFFGKKPAHVNRDIRDIIRDMSDINSAETTSQHNKSNFGSVEKYFIKGTYTDAKSENRKMYYMTRDGFSLLAMGFTGKKALQFKLAFLDKFNSMERELDNLRHKQHRIQQLGTYHQAMDAVKLFVDYAKSCGSTNADRYFQNFNRLFNKNIGVDAGQRSNLQTWQYSELDRFQVITAAVIKGGIAGHKHYKDIFSDVKAKIADYVKIAAITDRLLPAS